MNFWQKLAQSIRQHGNVILLYVVQSSGSSPGRQGFKMCVAKDEEMFGSIGGGIMEHKLVELSRNRLAEGSFKPFMKRQIHKPDVEKNRSGMICDGEQWVAFYYLDETHLDHIEHLSDQQAKTLILDHNGLSVEQVNSERAQFQLDELSEEQWKISEYIGFQNTAYIFGGGHVGLAMSKMMKDLDFRVVNFDDRENLNTMAQNSYADEKKVINYQDSEQFVPEGESSYIIVMSFGYKPDEVIMRRLLGRKYKYLGLMGSTKKIETMFKKLKEDGFSESDLNAVHSPIGIPIHSKTPMEIAVSIAAQIIQVKNQ